MVFPCFTGNPFGPDRGLDNCLVGGRYLAYHLPQRPRHSMKNKWALFAGRLITFFVLGYMAIYLFTLFFFSG